LARPQLARARRRA